MKIILFILSLLIFSCHKTQSEKPVAGSPYTNEISGSHSFHHVDQGHASNGDIYSYYYNDTGFIINFIDSGTLQIGSIYLKYNRIYADSFIHYEYDYIDNSNNRTEYYLDYNHYTNHIAVTTQYNLSAGQADFHHYDSF
jgi:hypothetical protein